MLVKISSNDLAYVVHDGQYVAALMPDETGRWIVRGMDECATEFNGMKYCIPEDADKMITRALSEK